MEKEFFKPISVKSPSLNPFLFSLRCIIDLQLGTIAKYLRFEISNFHTGEIIDIGAGESPWKEWLPSGCRYQGIDIRNSNEFGMSFRGDDIVLYDGDNLPFSDNFFDGAICIEVLEHAEDPEKLISEIARILKSGSLLLLTVPWSARRHHIPNDYHRFTRERLDRLLHGNNFKDINIYERGNDICAISNKLIVATIRIVKTTNFINLIFRLPLIALFTILSTIMLIMAYVSLKYNYGSKDDPLGYFCKAIKK